jgi:ligand-binding sensor domain-containing protein
MGLRKLLAFLYLLIAIVPVTAQEYSYARYDVKDGLAGPVVYHGVEDKDGFLWFATETGVSRFDGTHFRNFTLTDGLPDNEIVKLFVDSKGRIWMIPFKNAICYYWKGKIYNQENDSLLKKLVITSQIYRIVENKAGTLLLADYKSLHFITQDQQYKLIKSPDSGKTVFGNTYDVAIGPSGNFEAICITLKKEVIKIELDTGLSITKKEAYPYWPIFRNCNYSSPNLQIFRHGDSLLFTRLPGKTPKAMALPSNFNNLSVINDTLCAVSTGSGLFYYDIKASKVIRQVLQDKNVNAVLHDQEGNSWILTAGSGIYRIGSFEFTNFTFSQKEEDYTAIYSIYKQDSLVYAGADRSMLFIIDLKKQTSHGRRIFNTNLNSKISAIVPFTRGRIMLATFEGIVDLNGANQKRNKEISVKSMQVDGNRIVLSSQIGILQVSENMEYTFLLDTMRSTCSYAQGKQYYNGTLNGLYVLDSTGKHSWLGEKEPLFRSRVSAITGAVDGTVWIATHGYGVIAYKSGKIIHTIRQQDGLTSDIGRCLFIAGQDVWLGTDKGLNRLHWQEGAYQVTTFTRADGLKADMINAVHVDGSQVYVGTTEGITIFDADKISLHSICKLQITAIHAPDKQWPVDTSGFILPPAHDAIRFDYVGISYRSAGDITYQYRLVGLNENWQTTRETFLNFLSLPSGSYELQIRASNKFGVPSNMIRIPFQVEKLLWEKNWFRVLVLLVTGAFIWLFVYYRIKKANKQNDEKIQISNRMAELEQRALKAQMNPHFIFNSLNSVQQYVIDKDLLGANKFITEFSRLIRLTLDISSKTKISIYEEISYLTTYLELEKTKFEDKFTYSLVIAPDMDAGEWFIPPMILQPYVENSIRHGVRYRRDKQGHIKISFLLDAQYLVCQVEDNGVGRKKAGEYKSEMPIEYQSKGMTLTARRIEMFNQSNDTPVLIEIEDLELGNKPAGTRVTLRFPMTDASKLRPFYEL